MPHKANRTFFQAKRDWSKRKDLILSTYLKPYLAKVITLQRPILIVDGFAGAGRYEDGEAGSPVIIATAVNEALARHTTPIAVICIEQDDELHARLAQTTSEFPFVSTRHGAFTDYLDEIERLARGSTTFLYVDPYAIAGLKWTAMQRIFQHLQRGMSVEILLNFSASSFVRRGLAAYALKAPDTEPADAGVEPPSIEALNDAAGGDWWQTIVRDSEIDFAEQVRQVTAGYCAKLRQHFREVCEHPIRAHWKDSVPKYSLLFGSRQSDALILMNDSTIKSRDDLASKSSVEPSLFETRPLDLVPDKQQLPEFVLAAAQVRQSWRQLVLKVIREHFCQFTNAQINSAIKSLIRSGRLHSSSGTDIIKDDPELWRPA